MYFNTATADGKPRIDGINALTNLPDAEFAGAIFGGKRVLVPESGVSYVKQISRRGRMRPGTYFTTEEDDELEMTHAWISPVEERKVFVDKFNDGEEASGGFIFW